MFIRAEGNNDDN